MAEQDGHIAELEVALRFAIENKEAAEQQVSEEHLRVYGEELAKLPTRIAELEAELHTFHTEVTALNAELKQVHERMDWTVEDNAKKAIELEDMRAELKAARARTVELENA